MAPKQRPARAMAEDGALTGAARAAPSEFAYEVVAARASAFAASASVAGAASSASASASAPRALRVAAQGATAHRRYFSQMIGCGGLFGWLSSKMTGCGGLFV